jgi:hypothetical protein
MKVYVIWYMSEIKGGANLWGIFGTEEKAKEEVKNIKEECEIESAWYNEEEVL